MAYYNIPRDVKDSFYRYKMPRLVSKVEGRGNGIKTVIPNMSDIGKSLDRPAAYTTKFFGCELGALVSCDADRDRYLVNGEHDADKLQKLLDGFITKFVLCAHCRNPETDLSITKDERIFRVCKACGQRSQVDLTHKLVAYILKNPPSGESAKGGKSKKDKRNKKNAANGNGETLPTPPPDAANDDDDNDDAITKRIEAEAAALGHTQVDDDDWAEDTSPEAVAKRMALLAVKPKLAEQDSDDLEDPMEVLAEYLAANPAASDADIVAEVYSLSMREEKAIVVLAQVLFTENVLEQIPQRVALFRSLMKDSKCQKGLLGGIERLVGVNHPDKLMKKVPMILKALYDLDLLDEEVLLKWGEKVSKKYVDKSVAQKIHKEATPFLTWLLEAEEEETEDEEDED